MEIPVYAVGGGRWKIIGAKTNRTYMFEQGTPTMVDVRDTEELFKMVRKNTGKCCGPATKNKSTQLFVPA